MAEIASRQQLRMSFLRWALVCVPLCLLLGFLAAGVVPAMRDRADSRQGDLQQIESKITVTTTNLIGITMM